MFTVTIIRVNGCSNVRGGKSTGERMPSAAKITGETMTVLLGV